MCSHLRTQRRRWPEPHARSRSSRCATVSAPHRARRRRDAIPRLRRGCCRAFPPRHRGWVPPILARPGVRSARAAAGAIPIRVSRNGVVTLACADAMRAQQIQADADHLLAELSRIAGVSIARIDTVIADHALVLPEFEPPPARPVSPAALKAAEQAAEGMTAGNRRRGAPGRDHPGRRRCDRASLGSTGLARTHRFPLQFRGLAGSGRRP